MQQQRDRDRPDRYESDRDRYPPIPERPIHHRSTSSFRHGLPPPVPQPVPPSPRGYVSQSPSLRDVREIPSPSQLVTDPGAWSNGASVVANGNNNNNNNGSPSASGGLPHDMRPVSSTHRNWRDPAYPSVSPRVGDRLPSMTDYAAPRHAPHGSWDSYPKNDPYCPDDVPPGYPSTGSGGGGGGSGPLTHREQHNMPGAVAGGHPIPGGLAQQHPPHPQQQQQHPPPARPDPQPLQGSGPIPNSNSSGGRSNTSSKHAAPAADGSDPPPKKKKRRQAFSCAECAKRKQKCNRETPCQHCVSRKVPHLCVPSSRLGSPPPRPKPKTENSDVQSRSTVKIESDRPTGTSSSSVQTTMSVRVAKLEKMMNAVVSCVPGLDPSILGEWHQLHPETKPMLDQPPLAPLGGEQTVSALSSVPGLVPRSQTQETEGNESDGAWVGGLDRGTASRNPLPRGDESGHIRLSLDYHGTVSEQLKHIVEEGALSALSKSLDDLPPRQEADELVNFFFDKVNHLRYPIDSRLFRKSYEEVYASRNEINDKSVLSLPLIFAVLAIAMRLAPTNGTSPGESRRTQSLKLFWGAQFGIMIATSLNAENIQLVEARILLGLYLILVHERRLAEGWLMFRAGIATAFAIGLHRDGTRLKVLKPYEVEYRRRLWSYLCHADATYSCLIGRPPTIDPMFYDTVAPSNINLRELIDGQEIRSKAMSEPTFATYLIFRKRLADIVLQIVRNFQRLQGPTKYQEVKQIDAEMEKLKNDLPPHFRMVNPDKSLDRALWYLPTHRYYIQTEILHYTIILHRPWFLRQVGSPRYNLSRTRCWDAAVLDFNIRQEFHRETPDFLETLLGGSFREFNTATIAGICLLMEGPSSPHATDMWNILANFMDHHPHGEDELSKKEADIIYTLHKRAVQVQRQQHDAAPPAKAVSDYPPETQSRERISNERGGPDGGVTTLRPGSSAEDSSIAPSAGGLHTPASESGAARPEDQPQALFDQWLVNPEPNLATFNYGAGPVGAGSLGMVGIPMSMHSTVMPMQPATEFHWQPADGVVGAPGVVGPPQMVGNQFFPPQAHLDPAAQLDPNYWIDSANTFVNSMLEQAGTGMI